MLCSNCSKLSYIISNKNCNKCKIAIHNNLAIICDACSDKYKQCSICLKKLIPIDKREYGCGACKK